MPRLFAVLCLFACLVGCDTVQTTSGVDYLSKYSNLPKTSATATGAKSFEDEIRKVAAVEPTLKFPARIGLARLDSDYYYRNGQPFLSNIPPEEGDAWKNMNAKLGAEIGELIPINPMVVKMVTGTINAEQGKNTTDDVINQIRLGAARQHLDAVLIYQTYGSEKEKGNVLSALNITIIGGFLFPSRDYEATAYANGILIDVMQGYPYGSLDTASVVETESGSAWGWGSSSRYDDALLGKAKIEAAINLADKTYNFLSHVHDELQKTREKKDH